MKFMKLAGDQLTVSRIALGCMRISGLSEAEAERLIQTALECGINFFDHADIYGGGTCEEIFAKAYGMTADKREKIVIQSKCGIRPGFFDFSKEHILTSVDGILKRLNTDYLDVLLLHRPDTLMEPEEVAEAFDQLHTSGKVRYFGVSNQRPMQIELLQKYVKQRLIANQLQLSVAFTPMINSGIHANMLDEASVDHEGGILEYCRLKDITIQPWSPLQHGFFGGAFLDNPECPEINRVINAFAQEAGVPNTAVAIAWLLRHPANMQPIVGTTNAQRLADICRACEVDMSRPKWYEIYRAAGNVLP